MKEPVRMCESDELPRALRDAFGALGQDAPSAETVLRVQRALQALPAAAPGAAVVGTAGLSKLLVVMTLIAGAVTSAFVLNNSRLGAPRAEQPVSGPSPASGGREPPAAQATVATRVAAPITVASEAREPAASAEPAMRSRRAAQGRGEELVAPSRTRPRPSAGTRRPPALSEQTAQGVLAPSRPRPAQRAVAVEPAAAVSAPEVAPPARATTPDQPASLQDTQAPSALAPPPSAAAAQASEAQRLARCKQLALRDPEAALRQVEALTQDVPHGVFVQERELLAIRLHERLGHHSTAAELTRRFLERYPSSVYRRALAP